jgi:hypothetical protein
MGVIPSKQNIDALKYDMFSKISKQNIPLESFKHKKKKKKEKKKCSYNRINMVLFNWNIG